MGALRTWGASVRANPQGARREREAGPGARRKRKVKIQPQEPGNVGGELEQSLNFQNRTGGEVPSGMVKCILLKSYSAV